MDRAPLAVDALRRELLTPAGPLAWLDVVETSPSTSTALVERTRAEPGLAAPGALVAEHQVAGRGRAGRTWETPARAALTVSVLLRPHVPAAALGWVPLVAGLAAARAADEAGVEARLKWPNDVLVPAAPDVEGLGPYRKVAGVLAEVVPGGGVVVGVGLNVAQTVDELPVPTATSLALAGATHLDRGALLVSLVRELTSAVGRLEEAGGDARAAGLAREYADRSATLGTRVRAELAGAGGVLEGVAARVADDGALVVETADGERVVTAGDVHHLRTA
ncbi:biotin--[acetyl-CoA-carboxylase] ligase [Isoptericola variabilis]|uniref:biotin--[biotin carboxyl-carrier protein] ligase n=1 Tax=Isoptericola variabilis (strain 225) TaxID=743718 RepID=F6FPY5_ISOV2|nr:biotin--[acetyl-CoA-carboxylase] ligase [Isoptericola variabilis]AEG43774.1 biotin/acetyl-CoA-carboxylase ligase [Isoptericola variabilis 225]TWH27456.1 BirA family biotin operon repressor/biotin-[acetyl-CoA-carboxylase] ligase [Isoptericola variabilis J7]